MSGTAVLLNLLGGVALLLWGLHTVQTGMNRAFGGALHKAVSTAMANRFTGLAAGFGATVLLQSSTATALLVATFAGQGVAGGSGSIAALLGADLGTALVANLLARVKLPIVYVILLGGMLLYKLGRTGRAREGGRAVTGLGLMLLALQLIVAASEPMREAPIITAVFGALSGEPLLALLVGTGMTWLAHSSLAVVLLIATLASGGALELPVALALALGANIGNAIPPVLVTLGSKPEVRRIPIANIGMRAIGVAAVLPFAGQLAGPLADLASDPLAQVVYFHLLFNLGLLAVFLPLAGAGAAVLRRLLPEQPQPPEPRPLRPRFLDPAALDTPTVALAYAERDAARMAEITEQMLTDILQALSGANRVAAREARALDDVIDGFYAELTAYLAKISGQQLSEEDSLRRIEILTFTINLEHIGDLCDAGIGERVERKLAGRTRVPDAEWAQLQDMFERTIAVLRQAQALLVSGDLQLARDLLAQKIKFAKRARRLTIEHLGARPPTADGEASSFFIDTLRELKRVISYASSIAYPILERAGQLHGSRLVEPRDRDATA